MKKHKLFRYVMVVLLAVALLGCGQSNSNPVITLETMLGKIDETQVHEGSFHIDATSDYKSLEWLTLRNMRMYATREYSWSKDFANTRQTHDF